jgi:hypothetical protein
LSGEREVLAVHLRLLRALPASLPQQVEEWFQTRCTLGRDPKMYPEQLTAMLSLSK